MEEGAIDANPVQEVPPLKRRVDPEQIFTEAKRRALTPEEAGRLLAGLLPLFWWDPILTLLGTGLRFGELAGLRRRRVHLNRTIEPCRITLSFTRWPLALLLSKPRASLKVHHVPARLPVPEPRLLTRLLAVALPGSPMHVSWSDAEASSRPVSAHPGVSRQVREQASEHRGVPVRSRTPFGWWTGAEASKPGSLSP